MEDDRLTTVFYAEVNPDGTHGELKELGKGVIDISTTTMDEAVVDSFAEYLNCAIRRSASKAADVVIDAMIDPFILRSTICSGHLLNEVKKLVISNPPGGFNLLHHPDDADMLQFYFSELKSMGLYRMIPTDMVKKGTVYYVPCDLYTRTFGFTYSDPIDTVMSLFGTQATTTIIDELATDDQRKEPVRDISWIRKQMKHCKNPMERKALEKELNAAFKEKKRRRKNE